MHGSPWHRLLRLNLLAASAASTETENGTHQLVHECGHAALFRFQRARRRAEFWWYILVYIIIEVILGVIQSILGVGTALTGLFGLALLLPSVGVRRLHDIGRSGWWILIGFVRSSAGF